MGSVIGALSGYLGTRSTISSCESWMSSCPFPHWCSPWLWLLLSVQLEQRHSGCGRCDDPKVCQVGRGEALAVKEKQFIAAARASGAKSLWIVFHHILPNCFFFGHYSRNPHPGRDNPHCRFAELHRVRSSTSHARMGSHGQCGAQIPDGSVVVRHVSRTFHLITVIGFTSLEMR